MLTLDPSSFCDVCAESFGGDFLPQSLPCGHILCTACTRAIIAQTFAPRFPPTCPFCREVFSEDSLRLIRIDQFNEPNDFSPRPDVLTPRSTGSPVVDPFHEPPDPPDLHYQHSYYQGTQSARRLEDKLARIAARKSTVEEVSELHKELQAWLANDGQKLPMGQHSSLGLCAALIKAFVTGKFAFNDPKQGKGADLALRERNDALENDLQKQRSLYNSKVKECQQLKAELSRVAAVASSARNVPPRSTSVPPGAAPTTPNHVSSAATAAYMQMRQNAATPSPATYSASQYSRSATLSMQGSSRPSTPASMFQRTTSAPSTTSPSRPMSRASTAAAQHARTTSMSASVPALPPSSTASAAAAAYSSSSVAATTRARSRSFSRPSAPPPSIVPPMPKRTPTGLPDTDQPIYRRWIPPSLGGSSQPDRPISTASGRHSSLGMSSTSRAMMTSSH